MEDLDTNLSNAFNLISEVYEFTNNFIMRLNAYIQQTNSELEPIAENGFRSTLSRGDSPEQWFLRGIGNVYVTDEDVLQPPISENASLPFCHFLFYHYNHEKAQPRIIYGNYQDFELKEDDFSEKWALFRGLLYNLAEELGDSPVKFERDDLSYTIDCEVDPISAWVEDSQEKQNEKIENLGTNLAEKFAR